MVVAAPVTILLWLIAGIEIVFFSSRIKRNRPWIFHALSVLTFFHMLILPLNYDLPFIPSGYFLQIAMALLVLVAWALLMWKDNVVLKAGGAVVQFFISAYLFLFFFLFSDVGARLVESFRSQR